MTSNSQCNIHYIPYKEIVKQLEYHYKNQEQIKEKKQK